LFVSVLYRHVQTAVRQISLTQLAMHSTALVVPIELSALGKGIEYELVYVLPQSLQTNVATALQVRQRSLVL
jgi:hypothetical protein